MLPKKHRLSLRTEWRRVKKQGRLVSSKSFSLLIAQSQKKGDQPPCFAFIVSKKIHPQATKRNRVRRLLQEGVGSLLSQIRPGVEGVFLARRAALEINLLQVKTELTKVFRQANLIKWKNSFFFWLRFISGRGFIVGPAGSDLPALNIPIRPSPGMV